MEFQIRYARSGDLSIACEVVGDAPLDLLYVTSYESTPTLDNWTAEPVAARWIERLASFSRLILMDIRGTGLSDRRAGALEDGVDDMLAVLDAVGSERVGVLGFTTNMSLVSMYAAAHPDRAAGIVLYGAAALNPTLRLEEAGGFTPPELEAAVDEMILSDHAIGNNLGRFAPSLARDPRFRQWWIRKDVTFSSPGRRPSRAHDHDAGGRRPPHLSDDPGPYAGGASPGGRVRLGGEQPVHRGADPRGQTRRAPRERYGGLRR